MPPNVRCDTDLADLADLAALALLFGFTSLEYMPACLSCLASVRFLLTSMLWGPATHRACISLPDTGLTGSGCERASELMCATQAPAVKTTRTMSQLSRPVNGQTAAGHAGKPECLVTIHGDDDTWRQPALELTRKWSRSYDALSLV